MAKQKTREELIKEINLLNGERAEAESRLRENINNDALRREEIFALLGKSTIFGIAYERNTVPSWTQVFFELGKIVEKSENNSFTKDLLGRNEELHQALHNAPDKDEECPC